MLIKRVVIQGFKTFAKKTEFEFDPGVTAIVGPNGSGKSNVVDAIRWCMGEQSFSLLRSKKTSDIIFSGSDHKSRLGMAQVSLTLDNSNGELPVDFAEVEITRRAYRDGENEYLLNGRRVRLQDTTEILAQTGLGRRTYALIGQGLIDKVLSLAPEQLRSLFEEAAGITGYQAKRSTTLRRLDATQQNLTRVQDIVAELSPRLRYLRRQAERAEEREQIASDLRGLLRDWYGYHWHATLKDLTRQHLIVTGLQQRVQSLQQELSVLKHQIGDLRGHQTRLRGELGELHRESSVLHRHAEVVTRELAVAQERSRQVRAREEETLQELAPLHLERETLSARIAETEETIGISADTFETRQRRVDAVQATVAQRQHNRAQIQVDLSEARRRMADVQAELADTKSRLQQLEERKQALRLERETQESARATVSAEAKRFAQAVDAMGAQVTKRQQDTEDVRKEIDRIGSEILELRSRLEEVSERRQQAERDVDRLQTRHDLLIRLQSEGAGYASGVRSVLQAGHKKALGPDNFPEHLDGIIGTVASQIHVPSHLDKAIETALGGAFQNVITKSWFDTLAAIEYLKRSGRGRATFLPLDRLTVLPAILAPRMAGVLGNAVDLIQFDSTVADAVQQLLNRVWVVEKLNVARTALDSVHHGSRPTVVTLDGEIVRPGGAVTGGSDRTRRDDSILARERELRELPPQIQQASRRLGELIDQFRKFTEECETLTVQTTPLQSRLAEYAGLESDERERAEELRRHYDRERQAERWHSQRLVEIDQEFSTIEVQGTDLQESIGKLTAVEREACSALQAAEAAEEEAGTSDLLAQLADLRAEAAEAQGFLQSQRALIENQRRNMKQIDDRVRAKEQHIVDLAGEADELSLIIQKLSKDEEQVSGKISELQKKIGPSEHSLVDLEEKQSEFEVRERQIHESLRKDESAWNAAQLQWQRTDDRLRQLRHDIEQDLGLVLLERSDELAYQPPLPWDTIVEQLPDLRDLSPAMEDELREMRGRLSRVSNVNPDAPREYADAASRYEHLLTQSEDLEAAIADMRKVLRELDTVMEGELQETFTAVAEQFVHFFQVLFRGGTARLILDEPDDITNSGIEIVARPPGKRPTSLALLSGGERSLAACALIFSILRVSPTPFCVLDEVDAALDETNVDRFREALQELSSGTQFIIITHNRRTLEGTNAIYGITMGSDSTSRVISLRLDGERMVRQAVGDGNREEAEPSVDADLATIEDLVKL